MDERVAGEEVVVEVIEGQGVFGHVQFVNGQLAGDHHGDFGDLDREGIDIDAKELGGRYMDAKGLLPTISPGGKLVHALFQPRLKPFHLAVGDVQKIA